jgi:hypothetical protein
MSSFFLAMQSKAHAAHTASNHLRSTTTTCATAVLSSGILRAASKACHLWANIVLILQCSQIFLRDDGLSTPWITESQIAAVQRKPTPESEAPGCW